MTPDALDALIARLKSHDTPTICNAIEVVQGARGFSGFTRRTMVWTGSSHAPIVGFARTARIAGRNPPTETPERLGARRIDYFREMAIGERPGIAVIEDIDGDAAMGAWWGEIHAQIHSKVFGLSGVVTNGVVRDLGDLPKDFPILARSVGPSHGFVHVREIGVPVEVFGMHVVQGDLIHADRHGAVAIPVATLPDLGAALDQLLAAEAIIMGPLKDGDIDYARFEGLWAQFEKART